ncbi:MFS transporter [Pokkaliibacter plantistimulans]|uniref:MFS transporter n=1 Tax=Proteobacteria bacterium 228 TaxID=2083153 RepID=A0A2S5KR39_9PROT|nr:MFS transporter [Pokkaliibacter plantistimulans]PPC76726.1 MFS transporter [Pokkaliibacter plantistimulans]
MSNTPSTLTAPADTPHAPLTQGLVWLFAFCCGAIVANLYYSQPIIALIAPSVGLSADAASLIVSLTQIGYALGLLLLVPLGDLIENRKLMISTAVVSSLSLLAAAMTSQPQWFLAISLLVGISSVAVQMLIPMAAHMAPEQSRGRIVGNIMSGLLLGILLARPVSSLIADHFGWRTVYFTATALMVLIIVVMATTLPRHEPAHRSSYGQLLGSLAVLLRTQPILRQRSLYQGLMFATFSLFWTAVPLELAQSHGLSQSAIAVFALIGAVGAASAPIAGRLADAGHTGKATTLALVLAVLSMVVGLLPFGVSVVALAITGVLLDFAVQMNMVLGQRAIYALDPKSRARLNAIYMTSIFVGGALGSVFAATLYHSGGWHTVAMVGTAVPALALLAFCWHGRQAHS